MFRYLSTTEHSPLLQNAVETEDAFQRSAGEDVVTISSSPRKECTKSDSFHGSSSSRGDESMMSEHEETSKLKVQSGRTPRSSLGSCELTSPFSQVQIEALLDTVNCQGQKIRDMKVKLQLLETLAMSPLHHHHLHMLVV